VNLIDDSVILYLIAVVENLKIFTVVCTSTSPCCVAMSIV